MNPDRAVRVRVRRSLPLVWFGSPLTHAYSATTLNAHGEELRTRTFPTWADAMAFADRLARFIRTSHQITEERQ